MKNYGVWPRGEHGGIACYVAAENEEAARREGQRIMEASPQRYPGILPVAEWYIREVTHLPARA